MSEYVPSAWSEPLSPRLANWQRRFSTRVGKVILGCFGGALIMGFPLSYSRVGDRWEAGEALRNCHDTISATDDAGSILDVCTDEMLDDYHAAFDSSDTQRLSVTPSELNRMEQDGKDTFDRATREALPLFAGSFILGGLVTDIAVTYQARRSVTPMHPGHSNV
jgi:hypothetical protein